MCPAQDTRLNIFRYSTSSTIGQAALLLNSELMLKFGRRVFPPSSCSFAGKCASRTATQIFSEREAAFHLAYCSLVRVVDEPSAACIFVAAPEELDRSQNGKVPFSKGQWPCRCL